MNILAVDTSSGCCAAALYRDDRLIADVVFNHGKNHSVYLMPMIQEMMAACACDLSAVDYFACGVGPGSFTGVRIGVTTIKTFAQVYNRPCVGVDSLYAMCRVERYVDGLVVAMTDARRERVYAHVTLGGKTVLESQVLPVHELTDRLRAYNKQVLFIGDGGSVYAGLLESSGLNCRINRSKLLKASYIIDAALERIAQGNVESYLSLAPNYVMKSQAERERDERNSAKG